MTPELTLVAVAAIFMLAGLVKGVIGLGLPTVAIGLLGLVFTPAQAAALLIIPSLVSNVWQAAVGGHFRELLARLWPLLAGILVGSFFGAVFLPHSGSAEATLLLGIALTVYALLGLARIEFTTPARHEGWIGFVCGIPTGAIAVATGVFALPMVPYLQSLHMDRIRLVQALGLAFTTSTVALAAALQHAGELKAGILWPSLVALAAVLVGMRLGQSLLLRVSPRLFRLFFLIGLLALGLHLSLRGLY